MKKTAGLLLSLGLIVTASVISAFGQERQVAPAEGPATFERAVVLSRTMQGQEPAIAVGGNTFSFVTSEFSFDKLVKGAPYSAQAVTEMVQVLSDGNRIVNTSTAAVYRDNEGRTRREQSLKAIGPFAPSGDSSKTVSINDPVAGVSYVLEPNNRSARKIQSFRVEHDVGVALPAKAPFSNAETFTFQVAPSGNMQFKIGAEEAKVREAKERTDFRKEDLGTQTVEGVNAVGTKTTITIPAGQIGNERPIEIVDERWFSPDLQTVVMTRHSDPRSGETIYRLTNISRTEPDHSLFEVPADFTLRDDRQPPQRLKMTLDKQVPEE